MNNLLARYLLGICTPILIGYFTLHPLQEVQRSLGPSPNAPNLIFLLADDLRWDVLGYAGDPIIRTPALDSLAARGTQFVNAYVTTSICAVSRASILSGQYARRHGKWGFGPGFGADEWALTYPKHLRDAGYRTGFIGKYGVGAINYAREQFDYWRGFPGQGSFLAQDENGAPIHLTRLMGRQAAEFISSTPEDQPFALSISFKAPHVQGGSDNWQLYDPAFAEYYRGAEFPQALAGEVDYFNHFSPLFLDDNEARLRYFLRFGTAERGQASLEGYYRLVHGIDRAVSQIIATLTETGQLDNTVIIFTSDNGMYLGEYGFSGKWYGSDPSIRVPLLVVDPAQPEARERTEIALNIDIASTLLDYAGVPIPETMQGKSLRPFVAGESPADWRRDFLYEHLWPAGTCCYIPSVEGVVNDTAKYMRYFPNFTFGPLIQEELYDRIADPYEIENRADDPAFAAWRTQLTGRLDMLIDELD